MSATTTHRTTGRDESGRTPATRASGGRPGIPFGRLLHVELRKLVDTRSGRWLLITISLVTAAAIALVLAFAERESLTFTTFLTATSTPLMMLLPVLGILTATSEFSQRTGLVSFTQEPRRLRVVAAKAVAGCIVAVLAVALAVALAAAANGLAMTVKDAPGTWPSSWALVGGVLLAMILSVLQGVAFGLLIVVPGAAIAAFFILPTVLTILTASVAWFRSSAPWIDPSQSTAPLLAGSMTGTDWQHLVSSQALWVLLPLVVGSALLVRREIK